MSNISALVFVYTFNVDVPYGVYYASSGFLIDESGTEMKDKYEEGGYASPNLYQLSEMFPNLLSTSRYIKKITVVRMPLSYLKESCIRVKNNYAYIPGDSFPEFLEILGYMNLGNGDSEEPSRVYHGTYQFEFPTFSTLGHLMANFYTITVKRVCNLEACREKILDNLKIGKKTFRKDIAVPDLTYVINTRVGIEKDQFLEYLKEKEDEEDDEEEDQEEDMEENEEEEDDEDDDNGDDFFNHPPDPKQRRIDDLFKKL